MTALPHIWAHRGASAHAPENTLAAFDLAREMGADGIELDVQRSADGVLVVCHDEIIDRTSDGQGAIVDLHFDELRKYDFSASHPGFSHLQIPTLAEVFAQLGDSDLVINIELKNSVEPYPGMDDEVVALVRKHNWQDRVIISSFNHLSIAHLARTGCELPLGLLYVEPLVEPWVYASRVGVQAVHPCGEALRIDPDSVSRCIAEGIDVNVWTIDTIGDARAATHAGVSSIITNHPEIRRQLMKDEP